MHCLWIHLWKWMAQRRLIWGIPSHHSCYLHYLLIWKAVKPLSVLLPFDLVGPDAQSFVAHSLLISSLLPFKHLQYLVTSQFLFLERQPLLVCHPLLLGECHFGAAALSTPKMRLCHSFAFASFTSRNPSSLSFDRFNSKICTICRA